MYIKTCIKDSERTNQTSEPETTVKQGDLITTINMPLVSKKNV